MERLDDEPITDEEKTPEMLAKLLGVSIEEAEFILAIERGEIEGDVVDVEDKDA